MSDSITPITIRGRYFWRGEERFLIKGVAYQLHKRPISHQSDPLGDDRIEDVRRDIVLFKELGINALFVFLTQNFDPKKTHDAVMQLLADAGIYVLVTLSSPQCAINRCDPAGSYVPQLLEQYFSRIYCMAAYPNTLGVLVGNHVVNSAASTAAAPALRALTRDVKRYMALAAEVSGQRVLPVGYAASSNLMPLRPTLQYLAAGPREQAVDFFGFANFMWAGKASLKISGYESLINFFSDVPVPTIFTEYGANVPERPRIFQETEALYSAAMTPVFSGGFAYEFFEGANRYGLVKATEEEQLPGGEMRRFLTRLGDFENLKMRLARCAEEQPVTLPEWAAEDVRDTRPLKMPEVSELWLAGPEMVPACPLDWEEVRGQIEDRDWVSVGREDVKEEEKRDKPAEGDEKSLPLAKQG